VITVRFSTVRSVKNKRPDDTDGLNEYLSMKPTKADRGYWRVWNDKHHKPMIKGCNNYLKYHIHLL